MQLGSFVLASLAGMVGLVAGRVTSPAPAIVIAAPAAPVVRTVIAAPAVPAPVHEDEVDDADGIDIADAIAQAKAEVAAQPPVVALHGIVGGTLKDWNGEPAVGATVVATSPALQGEQVVITDENGTYMISALPAGYYTLTVYYNDMTTIRENVMVSEYTPQTSDLTLKYEPRERNIEVVADDPEPQEITIDKEYIRNIPVPGRTFEEALGSAALPVVISDRVIELDQ
ncbi:MAG: carboxypeptidase-like regulatory domain-containing protein [Kofleriaceae bacterium]